jgi:hypothetical protein
VVCRPRAREWRACTCRAVAVRAEVGWAGARKCALTFARPSPSRTARQGGRRFKRRWRWR